MPSVSSRLLLTIVALAFVASIGVLSAFAWRVAHEPLLDGASPAVVRVSAGMSARGIANQLPQAGIRVDPRVFVLASWATGTSRALRAGRYEVDPGMNLLGLLARLRKGEVLRERLTLPEGVTLREMRAVLDAAQELRHDTAGITEGALLKAVGATEPSGEGIFAPDTYLYDPGTSDIEVLRMAYRAQQARIRGAWERRAPALPYKSPYDALIMASLIEKETGRAEERRRIAGVFVNRERLGMLLQTDPSVIFGLGDRYDGRLHARDLTTDTPYNTYTRAGLPPTPIASPSRASIDAALDPEPTRALYFVARGDGTSEFSETLLQHNRAVATFQRGASR